MNKTCDYCGSVLTDDNIFDKDNWEFCSIECLMKMEVENGPKPKNQEEAFNRLCMLVSLLTPSKLLADYMGVFEKTIESLTHDERELLDELTKEMLGGFIQRAEEGLRFGPIDDIKSYFGMELKENYPEANDSFLIIAESYWTLVMLLKNLRDITTDGICPNKVIFDVFTKLEQDIASVFFPTPGPIHIESQERENMQRKLLSQFSNKLDVEAFIRGNPILIRDREDEGHLEWRKNIYAFVIIAIIVLVYLAIR